MIDVSEFQGVIRWAEVPAGIHHALVRVAYGANGVDAHGYYNLSQARSTGRVAGGYLSLEDGSAAPQVHNLLAHAEPRPGQLRGMIDVEPSKYSAHLSAEQVAGAADAYRALTGHWPILYGTASFLGGLHLPPRLAACPLMMAGYGPDDGSE